ncbi:hypothetical protein JW964_24635 [candidate division KSB1 bacterium]|nr:hypothetical protein [candidate division KSB1 bacterium]
MLLLNCKSPFATREAEEPIRARSNREIPSGPEVVLRNLQSAILDKNVIDYMYCLTSKPEKFTFIPDELVRQNNPTVFVAWSLEAEKNYISQVRNYVPRDSLSRLFFEEINSEVFADSAIMQRKYTLILKHTYQGNVPREMSGQAIFWIFKDEGHWFIRKWVDIGDPEKPNWSTLKAGFGK